MPPADSESSPTYDYLIVGSGLFGCVFARQMTDAGYRCLVIEQRHHVGGNIYSEKVDGIEVHKYGAHIFHTNSEEVWRYVNRFTDFNTYVHHVKVHYQGRIYSFPINLMTMHQVWGVTTPQQAKEKLDAVRIDIKNPKNMEEWALSQVGPELYEIFIKGYTTKHWMTSPTDLPASILQRIPIRMTLDDRYYNARYEGIPVDGYTRMIQRMLEGIETRCNTDFLSARQYWQGVARKIVYTGRIDSYFDYAYGDLGYRTMTFEEKILEGDYQGNSVVNYTDIEVPYTRVYEHKHFNFAKHDHTVVTWEYPETWNRHRIPYYPLLDDQNRKLYQRYAEEAKSVSNLIPGGRLATYQYFDMDQIIASALQKAAKELTPLAC